MYACLGLGVGGNLPVDAAVFLECLPPNSANILSGLATWWSVGTLIASMLAWAFIPNYSCAVDAVTCNKADNWGWRYLVLSLGAITFSMFLCRFFFFTLYESPKFLVSRGRQDEAVAAVQGIAHKNKTTTWLTEEILNEIGGYPEEKESQSLSTTEIIKRSFERFSYQQVAPLFGSTRLAISSVYPIFPFLSSTPTNNRHSHPTLAVLDLHRIGIYPFQRLPSPIPECQLHHHLRDLP